MIAPFALPVQGTQTLKPSTNPVQSAVQVNPAHPESIGFLPTQTCTSDHHVGPFRRREVYDAAPGWEGFGDCAACGSTVKVSDQPKGSPCHFEYADAQGAER